MSRWIYGDDAVVERTVGPWQWHQPRRWGLNLQTLGRVAVSSFVDYSGTSKTWTVAFYVSSPDSENTTHRRQVCGHESESLQCRITRCSRSRTAFLFAFLLVRVSLGVSESFPKKGSWPLMTLPDRPFSSPVAREGQNSQSHHLWRWFSLSSWLHWPLPQRTIKVAVSSSLYPLSTPGQDDVGPGSRA